MKPTLVPYINPLKIEYDTNPCTNDVANAVKLIQKIPIKQCSLTSIFFSINEL